MAALNFRFVRDRELLVREERNRVVGLFGALRPPQGLSPVELRAFQAGIDAARRDIDARTAARSEESFFMIYPAQNRFVVEQLTRGSKWPRVAVLLWAWLPEFAGPDGEVLVTREGLRSRIGCSKRALDGVFSELVAMGALLKLREPEPGKQGRGTVRYFINASVGTHLKRGARDEARRAAPSLMVLDGGLPTETRSRAKSASLPVL